MANSTAELRKLSTSLVRHLPFFLRLILGLVSYVAVLLVSLTTAIGQDKNTQRGFQPGNSFALGDFETINTTNGNLMLHFPVGSLPVGRNGLRAGFNLIYNSKQLDSEVAYFRDEAQPCDDVYGSPSNCPYFQKSLLKFSDEGGWRLSHMYQLKLIDRNGQYSQVPEDQRPQCLIYGGTPGPGYQEMINHWKLMITFPDGSSHMMRPLGFTDTNGNDPQGDFYKVRPDGFIEDCKFGTWYTVNGTRQPLSYYSTDGSYLRLDVQLDGDTNWQNNPWTLYAPDGTHVTGGGSASQRITDRNNNYVDVTDNQLKDQFNRTVTLSYNQQGETLITSQGFGGTLTWKVRRKMIRVRKTYNGCQSPNCPYPHADPETFDEILEVVDRITLPEQAGGLSYTFDYNAPDYVLGSALPSVGWGEVSGVTSPASAHVSYSYLQDNEGWANTVDVVRNSPTQKTLSYEAEYDGLTTPVNETWTYSINPGMSLVTNPDGGVTREDFGSSPDGYWATGLVYKTTRPDGSVVERIWAKNDLANYGVLSWRGDNPYVKTEFTSIKNAVGTLVLTARKDYQYDKNGNVTSVKEYDWVPYGSIPRDAQGNPPDVPASTDAKRVTVNSYYAATPDAGQPASGGNVYWLSSSPLFKRALAWTEVRDHLASHVFARTELTYDYPFTKGNLIQKKSWDSSKGSLGSAPSALTPANSISVATEYNQFGDPTLVTDAKGYQTQLIYGPVGGFNDLYPTQVKTAYGTTVQRTENRDYDFSTGLTTRVTDVDNNVSTGTDYDVFGRPTLVKAAEGVQGIETRTRTEYNDALRRVIVRADLNTIGDGKLVQVQHYDQLGRVRLTRQLEDSSTQSPTDETQGIKVQTRYKFYGSNSFALVSHPYREATSSQAPSQSMDWTRTMADNGGRIVEQRKFGAGLPWPWGSNTTSAGGVTTAYDANFSTMTDQAGNARRSMINGLGQLVRVDEPDKVTGALDNAGVSVQSTNYTYDMLGNLKRVDQGEQHRYFLYDSLSRLIRARNPEQETNALNTLNDPFPDPNHPNSEWSFKYVYDDNGNLLTRTDPRGVITSYGYDALNRNMSVSCINDPANTPAVTRSYDGATNGKGRLWKSQTSGDFPSLTTIDAYDALGRPGIQRQQFGGSSGLSFTVQRAYDLAGHVLSQTYPSGHTVNYNYDQAGRLADKDSQHPAFSGNLGDGETRTYVSALRYDEANRLKEEKYGTLTPLFHKLHYNARGQLYDVRLSTQSWNQSELDGDRGALINYYSNQNFTPGYVGSDNNGNVTRAEHHIPGSGYLQENYEYDKLNRLISVTEKQNGQTAVLAQAYDYDRYGNRTINQGATWSSGTPINSLAFGVDSSTNRLTAPPDYAQLSYDPAGNLTQDSTSLNVGNATYIYDAENRLSRVHFGGGGGKEQEEAPPDFQYFYDADGRRVRRITPDDTWQVYGMDGELLAEYYAGSLGTITVYGTSNTLPRKEYGYRDGQLLVTAGNNSDNRIGRFVMNQYFAALGRAPSTVEFSQQQAAFIQATQQGQAQFFAVAQNLGQQLFDVHNVNGQYNARGRSNTQFVTDLYFGYLQRPPDSGGLNYYVNQLEQGVSRTAMRDGFASSATVEFVALVSTVSGINNGNLSDPVTHYLSTLYLAVPGGASNWDTHLASLQAAAAEGQSQVMYAARTVGINRFQPWVSDANKTHQQFVTALFNAFLQREPSNSEVNNWVGTVQSQGRAQALQSFASLLAAQELAGTLYREILWLTADHLGTPRMISERSGSLAGIKRHDYLPFGEELPAGQGGRATTQGYGAGDSIRQKFTSKERDNETGLDYFLARYYAGAHGRFTGTDPLLASGRVANPQTWNRYAYVLNNPLQFVDPDGLAEEPDLETGQQPPPPPRVDFTATRLVYQVPTWHVTDEGELVSVKTEVTVNLPTAAASMINKVYENTYTAFYQPAQEQAAKARVGTSELSGKEVTRTKGNDLELGATVGVVSGGTIKETGKNASSTTATSSTLPQLQKKVDTMVGVSTYNDNAIHRLANLSVTVPINGRLFSQTIGTETATNLVRMAARIGQAAALDSAKNAMSTVP